MLLRFSILLAFTFVTFAPAANAASANCEKNADEISFSASGAQRTVTLVSSYDPEDGTYDSSQGVYYFKATLKRGQGYTIWTQGVQELDPSETNRVAVSVSTYPADPKDDDDDGPGADFSEVDEPGANQRLILYYDDWYVDEEDKSENDPKKWTYYIEIQGNVGDEVTINFQLGAVIPKGREDNPLSISPSGNISTITRNLQIGDEYYMRARLVAGQMYWFATSGGVTNNVLSVDIVSDAGSSSADDEEDSDFAVYADPVYDNDDFNVGLYVVPEETGYFSIVVSGGDPESSLESGETPAAQTRGSGAPFGFSFRSYQKRDIRQHKVTELTADNMYTADFTAGYKNAPENLKLGLYDEIIDESLFRFSATKGGRYLVQTENAETNLLMRVYDAKGTILCENKGDGRTLNSRCAFETPLAGDCYVGVCQLISNEFMEEPSYTSARIVLSDASPKAGDPDAWDPDDEVPAGANGLSPLPASLTDDPEKIDIEGHGWHQLNERDWADTFMIGGRKGLTYRLRVTLEDPENAFNELSAEVFTLKGTKETPVTAKGDVNARSEEPLSFTASANETYYIRLKVKGGQGLDFPKYRLHTIGCSTTGEPLGILKVVTKGAAATWTLDRETVKYPGGSSILVAGLHSVKFGTVSGYKVDFATQSVSVAPGTTPTVVTGVYSDTFDPKDDVATGATAWSLKNTVTTMNRTLWKNDLADNFSFAGKDGQYYDFTLRNGEGCDAVFTISNPELGVLADKVTSVTHLLLPTTKAKYQLNIGHSAGGEGAYAIEGFFANVGTIKFGKNAVTAKENAATVAITVNRTAKDGVVRVRYGTVAGTARPGVDYVAQNGVLEWAANDNKAKTILVKLIPDLVPVYEGNKTFSVRLEPVPEEEMSPFEYPATIVGDTCVVTLQETSKPGATVESAYAAKAPKLATVKTEDTGLATGSFYGTLCETGSGLTNGLPRLASIAFTASATVPAKLSAKVSLGGKSYTFAASGWDLADGAVCEKTFSLVQKVNNIAYTNILSVSVADGSTLADGDWLKAGGTVKLVMNVPDANGRGVQKDICYVGSLWRNNAKVQDYLTAVTNFTGYYTIALVPDTAVGSGLPAGNGYLTLTVDNKGTAKVAGLLADGVTKPSLSVAACAIRPDSASSNGYALHVPLFLAKSPMCFGGELRLYADAEGRILVDSHHGGGLEWHNDNKALTYDGLTGYSIGLQPVGGYYDTIVCLQTYYLTRAFEIGTIGTSAYPVEAVALGYSFVPGVEPDGLPVDLSVDVFSASKQVLAKSGKLVDFSSSVNPCNVQLKAARATGLVNGSFALWTVSDDATVQKQITGIKHFGVLILNRESGIMDDSVVSAGFFTQALTVVDEPRKSRKWTFSAPFNLLGIDQGTIDWWADDWGSQD